jgi:MOSC domain-containing protein
MGDCGICEIIDLRRYPVKSMLGESLTASEVGSRGLAGDRTHALVHTRTGKIASAKHPRLWRDLLTLAATVTPDGVRVAAPDGTVVESTDPTADDVLSRLVGQPVALTSTPPAVATLDRARPDAVLRDGVDADVPIDVSRLATEAPDGTFFDFAPIHLATTATLRRIEELGRIEERGRIEEQGRIDPDDGSAHRQAGADSAAGGSLAIRYRPNIVVGWPDNAGGGSAIDGGAFVEDAWVGRLVGLGDEVVLRVIAATPRCAIPTLAHGRLPRDVRALRVLADHHRIVPLPGLGEQPCAGVYAQPIRAGRVRLGDRVRLVDA